MHGARVVTVREAGAGAGDEADAAVTTVTGAVLAVHTADCAPIALVADGGGVAVAHAGWRGLADGVVAAAVDAAADRGRGARTGPGRSAASVPSATSSAPRTSTGSPTASAPGS